MVRIYRKKEYNVYSDRDGTYVIHNTNKDFSQGHTHINNFNTAKFIINMAIHRNIPVKHVSDYIITSIIRISNDNAYKSRLERIIKNKPCKPMIS